jgi:hypothetical protein
LVGLQACALREHRTAAGDDHSAALRLCVAERFE